MSEDLKESAITWDRLIKLIGLERIVVIIKKPVREGAFYTQGELTGFKSGIFGGGHYNYKHGEPHSFDSRRLRFIKPPKVHVTYNIGDYGGRQHSDWIDVENCLFSFDLETELTETYRKKVSEYIKSRQKPFSL